MPLMGIVPKAPSGNMFAKALGYGVTGGKSLRSRQAEAQSRPKPAAFRPQQAISPVPYGVYRPEDRGQYQERLGNAFADTPPPQPPVTGPPVSMATQSALSAMQQAGAIGSVMPGRPEREIMPQAMNYRGAHGLFGFGSR